MFKTFYKKLQHNNLYFLMLIRKIISYILEVKSGKVLWIILKKRLRVEAKLTIPFSSWPPYYVIMF